jgi:hypothetical protein
MKEACRMRIMLHTTEQGRKNQNHAAERKIGFLAKRWKLRMKKKKVQNGYGIMVSFMRVNCCPARHAAATEGLDMRK